MMKPGIRNSMELKKKNWLVMKRKVLLVTEIFVMLN